ncbi:GTP cyclohydrolase II [Candidatus Marinamargulisbacteria bacterium SCGC AG-410-N11]|nr:GTP cyclohydrolase II [Candidatus Marinamargulisbacteria bacterium SCGC AG-410-N11]
MTVKKAINEIKNARFCLIIDDEEEIESGLLVTSAHYFTPEKVKIMIDKGNVNLVLHPEKVSQLGIPVKNSLFNIKKEIASVSYLQKDKTSKDVNIANGILAISNEIDPFDFELSGNINIHICRQMGVLRKSSKFEAAVDLVKLANLSCAAVVKKISLKKLEVKHKAIKDYAKSNNYTIVKLRDLINYKLERESYITLIDQGVIKTQFGKFKMFAFKDKVNNKIHIALVKGEIKPEKDILVRVHSECLTGDVFHSLRCDCGNQLSLALNHVAENGSGIVLYMRQEGRGIGLLNKLKAYKLQDKGLDTVEANQKLGFQADLREYGVGAQILRYLGVKKISLLTNNPKKIIGLKGFGLTIHKRVALYTDSNSHNRKYLKTKKKKLGHML